MVAAEAVDDVRGDAAARPVRGVEHDHVEPRRHSTCAARSPASPAPTTTTSCVSRPVQRRRERLVEGPVPELVTGRLQLRRDQPLAESSISSPIDRRAFG